MNKRGYIGESVVNLWAIIFIVLVIIGFWLLFNASSFGKKGVESIIESEIISENNKLLINYLRSDVVVDEKKMSFADLIALSYVKQHNYETLRIETMKFMEKNDLCFDLIISLLSLPELELEIAGLGQEIKIEKLCQGDVLFGRKVRRSIKPSYTYVPVLSGLAGVELILYE